MKLIKSPLSSPGPAWEQSVGKALSSKRWDYIKTDLTNWSLSCENRSYLRISDSRRLPETHPPGWPLSWIL